MFEVWVNVKSKYSFMTKSVRVETLEEAEKLDYHAIYQLKDPTKRATAKNRLRVK